jgi:hypothetical protein
MFRISQDPSLGSNKKLYLTKITYNCSTAQVVRCQCLAAYAYAAITLNTAITTSTLEPAMYF